MSRLAGVLDGACGAGGRRDLGWRPAPVGGGAAGSGGRSPRFVALRTRKTPVSRSSASSKATVTGPTNA